MLRFLPLTSSSSSNQIIGFLGLFGGGIVAIAGIIQAQKISEFAPASQTLLGTHDVLAGSKVAIGIQIAIYGLLALLSIVG